MSVAGVVAALGAEARTLGTLSRRHDRLCSAGDGLLVVVSGVGHAAALAAARDLVAGGADGLISWGLAGGLDPALHAGDLCLPTAVVSREGKVFATADPWRERIRAAIAPRCRVTGGTLLGSSSAVGGIGAKAAAFGATGAAAVDMESLAVAEVAYVNRLPFVTVRAIVDEALDEVPRAALGAGDEGPLRLPKLLCGLLRSPSQIPPLMRLGLRYRTATRTLAAAARGGSQALCP